MSTLPTDADALMNQAEAAEYLGITRVQIRNWRRLGYGPSFIRVGARGDVRYAQAWLDEWRADVAAGRAWWPVRGPRKKNREV